MRKEKKAQLLLKVYIFKVKSVITLIAVSIFFSQNVVKYYNT